MGKVGREMSRIDHAALIERLNAGVAAELHGAFRYLLLAKLVRGPRARELADMFERMSRSEWTHLALLVERIVQLGGRPLDRPAHAEEHSYAAYQVPPPDPADVRRIVEETLVGERAAIRYWQALFEMTKDHDPVTAALATGALADEVRDEDALERVLARDGDGVIDQASADSFPASDAPPWSPGTA